MNDGLTREEQEMIEEQETNDKPTITDIHKAIDDILEIVYGCCKGDGSYRTQRRTLELAILTHRINMEISLGDNKKE